MDHWQTRGSKVWPTQGNPLYGYGYDLKDTHTVNNDWKGRLQESTRKVSNIEVTHYYSLLAMVEPVLEFILLIYNQVNIMKYMYNTKLRRLLGKASIR